MQELKTFFAFQNVPSRAQGWDFLGNAPCSRAAGLRGRTCQDLPSGSVQDKALGCCQCSSSHCLFFHFTAIDGAAQWVLLGKPQSLEPFEKLSECWHMPLKHGLKRILITPLIEQAGKHLKCKYFPGTFFWEKMRMHSWKSSLHSISPVAIKRCDIDWRSMANQEICDSTPLQFDFWETYIIASLHLFWLLQSSVAEVGWGIKIQMHAQFREENDLDITLTKSTICAGNKISFFFSFALKGQKSSKSSSPQDSPSKCTRIGLNLIFDSRLSSAQSHLLSQIVSC